MAAGGFLGSFRTRNDFVAPVMAKSISLAKQLAVQAAQRGGLSGRRRVRRRGRAPASARYLHGNPQILTMPRKSAANRRRIVRP